MQLISLSWVNHSRKILIVTILLMLIASVLRLSSEFYRLVWQKSFGGAIDLGFRYEELRLWFLGSPVYEMLGSAAYPPATYAILWPFLGWLSFKEARWLWAGVSVVMLVWMAYLLTRESLAGTRLERIFIIFMALSIYPTSVAIGNGQFILPIIPLLLTALILVAGAEKWNRILLGALLMVIALASPSITAPFFWIILFVPRRITPAALVVAGYAALTLLACMFQSSSFLSLILHWLEHSRGGAAYGAVHGGYGNLHSFLAVLGTDGWNTLLSLLLLAALGIWVYKHRRVDLWVLIGVTAIVARFWTYHRVYDDLLILLPMITLFRIMKQDSESDGVSKFLPGVLLAIALISMLGPARLISYPPPWNWLVLTPLITSWFLIFIFLLCRARLEQNRIVFAEKTRRIPIADTTI